MVELWGGLECTVNRIGDRFFDQQRRGNRCGDAFGPEEAFARIGIKALRFPVLWETCAADPGHLEAVDCRMAALERLGMRAIIGLLHHGSGPLHTDLLADDFAAGLAGHAAAVARRYPHVRDWTPVNEPLTTARFSCAYGYWYPHTRTEAALWTALLNQLDATRLAMRAIRDVNPEARLIQTDDLGMAEATPELAGQQAFENQRRWLTWDLLAGMVVPGHPLWSRIAGHGLGDRLRAIADDPCPADVIGINHYLCSNRYLTHRRDLHPDIPLANDGTPCINLDAVRTAPGMAGPGRLLRQAWERYRTPLAITECHNGSTREEQMRWFHQGWQAAVAADAEGIPVEAVTAWSLLGSHDWNSLLTRNDDHYEPGVFDVRSQPPRPTAMAGLLMALARGDAPPLAAIVKSPGWWQRPERMLPGYAAPAPVPPPAGPPILITGASGTLARAIAAHCEVRGLAHVATARGLLDLTDPATVGAALDRFEPWAIINCAGLVDIDHAERSPGLCHRVNAIGPETLARLAAERGMRFVHISSDQVFDGRGGMPLDERARTRALNCYGRAKAESERRVRWACPDALIVRTAAFFSADDAHNFAVHALAALAQDLPFAAAADQIVSPTYVPDLVTTLLDLLIDGERGVWHLANAGGLDWADFACALAEASDLPRRMVRRASGRDLGQLAPRPADARLTSIRGRVMPDLGSAISRFAAAHRPAQPRLAAE